MNRLRRAWRRLADERGAVLVLSVLMLSGLVGMTSLTVDIGHFFVERRQIQNAVDAAALAAAAYLPTDDPARLAAAVDEAISYGAQNGVVIAPGDITISTTWAANDTVEVTAARAVAFAFARVLGVDGGTASADALAQIGSLAGATGVLPLGVEYPTDGLVFGETYCLKLGSGGSCAGAQHGNFGALDIDHTGSDSANVYRSKLTTGSLTTVRVNDHIDVVHGNMAGPTAQGLGCDDDDGRLTGNTQSFSDVVEQIGNSYRVLDWTSPRLALLPLVTYPNANEAIVGGFGLFFIEDCGEQGSVLGRAIDTVIPGASWGPYRAGEGTRTLKITR